MALIANKASVSHSDFVFVSPLYLCNIVAGFGSTFKIKNSSQTIAFIFYFAIVYSLPIQNKVHFFCHRCLNVHFFMHALVRWYWLRYIFHSQMPFLSPNFTHFQARWYFPIMFQWQIKNEQPCFFTTITWCQKSVCTQGAKRRQHAQRVPKGMGVHTGYFS